MRHLPEVHRMCVTECGLKRVASKLGIPYAPSWESYIRQITTLIEKEWKDKTPEWKHEEPFFKELLGDLHAIKIAWRNPTMHVVRNYGAEEAEQIFKATQVLMGRLAENFAGTAADANS
jgi:hypothetical protein